MFDARAKRFIAHRLAAAGQEHVLQFWDQLDSIEQQRLTQQVTMLDIPLLQTLVEPSGLHHDWSNIANRAKSPSAIRCDSTENRFSRQEARNQGERALRWVRWPQSWWPAVRGRDWDFLIQKACIR